MARYTELLTAARAEALFNTDLTAGQRPSQAEVVAGIARAVRAHGGVRGCAAEVAAAYGEYPETAPARMRWARAVVEDVYGISSGWQVRLCRRVPIRLLHRTGTQVRVGLRRIGT